jgi:Domain of unknown function (DUF1707)
MESNSARRHLFGCGGGRHDSGAGAEAGTGWDEPAAYEHGVPRPTGDADLRVSDAERQAAADELKAHFGAGRINMDEFDERLQVALSARTRRELADVLKDLPRTGPSAARSHPHRAWPPFVPVMIAVALVAAVGTTLGAVAFGPFHHFIFPWWIAPVGLFFLFRRWRRPPYGGPRIPGRKAWLN